MNNKVATRQSSKHVICSKGPDVCLTPMGSSKVPVPYTSTAFLGGTKRHKNTVRYNNVPAVDVSVRASSSTGTEPGTGKGIVKKGHLGPAATVAASKTVASNGHATGGQSDKATINMPNPGAKETPRKFR